MSTNGRVRVKGRSPNTVIEAYDTEDEAPASYVAPAAAARSGVRSVYDRRAAYRAPRCGVCLRRRALPAYCRRDGRRVSDHFFERHEQCHRAVRSSDHDPRRDALSANERLAGRLSNRLPNA